MTWQSYTESDKVLIPSWAVCRAGKYTYFQGQSTETPKMDQDDPPHTVAGSFNPTNQQQHPGHLRIETDSFDQHVSWTQEYKIGS